MNLLDAKIVKIAPPVWDEQYKVFRVAMTYECYGRESETEQWFKEEEKARLLKVGDIIQV